MNSNKDTSSGYAWEGFFFGIDSKTASRPAPLDYRHAMSVVMNPNLQTRLGWNPSIPRKSLALSMFQCIQSYLPESLRGNLRLYCALGTSLDIMHGIDGLFDLGDGHVVTFDLTARRYKTETKADFLLTREQCIGFNMWRIAKDIAELLLK